MFHRPEPGLSPCWEGLPLSEGVIDFDGSSSAARILQVLLHEGWRDHHTLPATNGLVISTLHWLLLELLCLSGAKYGVPSPYSSGFLISKTVGDEIARGETRAFSESPNLHNDNSFSYGSEVG